MTSNISYWQAATALVALTSVPACAKPVDQAMPVGQARTDQAASGVTLKQFQQRQQERLMAGDTDGDSRLSRTEFSATAKGGKGDPAKRFAKLDRNGDGNLDPSEIEAMLMRQFKRLDADGNGVASPSERAAARNRMQQVNKADPQP